MALRARSFRRRNARLAHLLEKLHLWVEVRLQEAPLFAIDVVHQLPGEFKIKALVAEEGAHVRIVFLLPRKAGRCCGRGGCERPGFYCRRAASAKRSMTSSFMNSEPLSKYRPSSGNGRRFSISVSACLTAKPFFPRSPRIRWCPSDISQRDGPNKRP